MNFQAILDSWNIKADVNMLLGMWNESHRHYHTLDHLNDLVDQINAYRENTNCSKKEYEKLLITALFHDIVYDPMKSNNEEMSADFFLDCCQSKNQDIEDIKNAILETKTHTSTSKLSSIFNEFDMKILERGYNDLLEWEKGIYEEFKGYGSDVYKQGRIKFLESVIDKYPRNSGNLSELIKYVKSNY